MAGHFAQPGKKRKRSVPDKDRGIVVPEKRSRRAADREEERGADRFQSATLNKTLDRRFSELDALLCGISLLLLITAHFLPTHGLVRLLTFLVPFALAGYGYLFEAFQEAFMGIVLGREIIVTVASLMAFCAGSYFGGAAVMVFLKLCDLALAFAESRQNGELRALYSLCPETANMTDGEQVVKAPAADLPEGSVIAVYEGETIPIDGVVIEGVSALDASPLVKRSLSFPVSEGSAVVSGCINIGAPLRIRTLRDQRSSVSSTVIRAAENAWMHKSAQERIMQRVIDYASPALSALALLIAIIPSIVTGEWREWLCRAAVILSVSQMYSCVQSVKLCFDCASARAAASGAFFKGHDVIEAFSRAETFVFDKTGTVTEGRYVVKEVCPEGVSEEQLLYIAGAAELESPHPIARAIVAASGVARTGAESVEIEEKPGRGVSAFIGGRNVYVGNAALMEEHGIAYTSPKVTGSAIHVAVNGSYVGHIVLDDAVKDGAFDAIEELRVSGVKNSVLLTGDVHSTARKIASSLNFDMIKAELTPDDKVKAVEYLMSTRNINTTLAFVGDGVCDTEALRRAPVGVALGCFDRLEAIEAADTAILGSDIRTLPLAYKTAVRAQRSALENTVAAGAVKLIVLVFGAAGVFGLGLSVLLQTAAVLFCAANALRVLYFENKRR